MGNSHLLHVPIVFAFIALASAIPIPIPALSTRAPSTSDLSCGPATWDTIVLFYILNYGTHAFTIKRRTGEGLFNYGLSVLGALLVPYFGIVRACGAILKAKVGGETQLQHALRMQVLCTVVRDTDESVEDNRGPNITKKVIKATESDIRGHVHGQFFLPHGYTFRRIVETEESIKLSGMSQDGSSINLSASRNISQSIVAIIQLIFACITLYRTRGDQLDRFGYAAYGLTVVQYAVMSLVNLIANMTTPSYPSLYMVRTKMMEEAERHDGKFFGWVATVMEDESTVMELDTPIKNHEASVGSPQKSEQDPKVTQLPVEEESHATDPAARDNRAKTNAAKLKDKTQSIDRWTIMACAVFVIAMAAPYAIIGGISGFQDGESTRAQRGWTISWLVFGQVFGGLLGPREYFFLPWGAPAIGGFVVVGQMIMADGVCILAA
jgi:hypothetical protein